MKAQLGGGDGEDVRGGEGVEGEADKGGGQEEC